MLCPRCHSSTRVLESRRAPDGNSVRRRRECSRCAQRFTTVEGREPEPLYVIKRDADRQRFDRTKLRAGLIKAAHKRPVTASDIEAVVDQVEVALADAGGELSSERIGELCLEALRRLDAGAYLQFAGTLAEPPLAISGQTGAVGSVREPRKDSQFPAKAAARRGSDE